MRWRACVATVAAPNRMNSRHGGMYRHDGSKPGSHAQSVWDWGLGPMEQWRHEE